MANHTFPQTGDFSDGENFAHLFGQDTLLDYVETGFEFTVDYTVPEVAVSTGKAYVSIDSGTTANTNEERTKLGYVLEHDAETHLLQTNDVNYVFITGNVTADDSPQIDVNTTGTAPTQCSVLLGTIDTANETYEQLNRTAPTERLIQSDTPTHDREGAMWYKPSNGLIYFDNGTEFAAVPEVGYQEGEFSNPETKVIPVDDPPRTTLDNNTENIRLIDEQRIADFEDGSVEPVNGEWIWDNKVRLSAQTGTVISGTYSLEMDSNSQDLVRTLERNKEIQQDLEITLKMGNDTGNINDFVELEVGDGTDYSFGLRWNDGSGNFEYYDVGGTATEINASWANGDVYDIEFDPDYDANTVNITINGATVGNFSYTNALSGLKRIKARNNTSGSATQRFIYLDDLNEGAREIGEAIVQFRQPDSRIVDWDIFDFGITEDNERVQVDLENPSEALLISDVQSRQDISSIAGSVNFQLRVTLERADEANSPTFNSWYRRFTKRPGDSTLSDAQQEEIRSERRRADAIAVRLARRF